MIAMWQSKQGDEGSGWMTTYLSGAASTSQVFDCVAVRQHLHEK
jgi:hypothetical protein